VPFSRSQILKRYRTVLGVLSRYGFGFMAEHLGLAGSGAWRWLPGAARGGEARGERLRRAFEELGPAFVKLGQLLSTQSDLLPPDILAALERLQDQVEPFPFQEVRVVVERELHHPLEQLFDSFDPEPVAAASLGQVHQAVLVGGEEVVVKVQRPGVAEQVELDLQVLQGLAALAARRTQWGRQYDLPAAVAEFAATLRKELDYRQEGRNAERFRENFTGDSGVYFPAVFWAYTSDRVLALERVEGLRVTDREKLVKSGVAPSDVAQRLAGALFRMVLRDGFVHADPHPGNLFVRRDGTLIFVDFGMVGELTDAMRANVVDYVLGVVTEDSDQVVEAILRMGVVRGSTSLPGLRREVERMQRKYGQVPLSQIQLGPALRDTMAIARRFQITIPSGYVIMLKALTTLEAVARQIYPEATLIGLAAPYAELILQGRFKPDRLLSRLGRDLADAGRHGLRIPRQVSRVLAMMEEGEWRLAIDHTGLEPAMQRLTAITNRLSIAILLASLIIGTALVSSGSKGGFLQRYPIADAGFMLIGAVGLWLILSILGSARS
jgi:ubiquinone biosynthesis protein